MPNTIYETRRRNLQRLTQYLGAKTALALKLGITQAQISHWLREDGAQAARDIKEDSARDIEAAMGLTPGELDWPDGKRPDTAPLDSKLLAQCTSAVLLEAGKSGLTVPGEKVANLVTLAYAHALAHNGTIDQDYVRQLVQLL
jgi:transcriptional regulator with XRE-family HTH domain